MNSWLTTTLDFLPAERIVLTMLHSIWQGSLIAAGVWAGCRMLRSASAQSRYAISLAGLLAMACGTAATFALVDGIEPVAGQTAELRLGSNAPIEDTGLAAQETGSAAQAAERNNTMPEPGPGLLSDNGATVVAPSPNLRVGNSAWMAVLGALVSRLSPYLAAVYLCGVATLLARLLIGVCGGQSLRNRSQPAADHELLQLLAVKARGLGLRAAPALRLCHDLAVPTVVGVVRPAIILPVSLVSGISRDQLGAILAHELAHIKRYDYLVNLAQRVIEALLFYHPAVWLLSRQVRIERENCCDDVVVSQGFEPVGYARLLVEIAEHVRQTRPAQGATALATLQATGGNSSLAARVRRLVDVENAEPFRLHRGVLLAMLLIGGLTGTGVTLRVKADSAEAAAESSPDRQWTRIKFVPGHGGFPSQKLPSGVSLATFPQDDNGIARFVVALSVDQEMVDPSCLRIVALNKSGDRLEGLEYSFVAAEGKSMRIVTFACRFPGPLSAIAELAIQERPNDEYDVPEWPPGSPLLAAVIEQFPELAEVRSRMSIDDFESLLPSDSPLESLGGSGPKPGETFQFAIRRTTFYATFIDGELANLIRVDAQPGGGDPLGPRAGLTPRETVQGFIAQVARGKQTIAGIHGSWDHAWAWTTREHGMDLNTGLFKRPGFKPIAQLGNDHRMLVLTGTERASVSSVQDRVGVFELVRRDGRWLIETMSLYKPESAWSFAAGFARNREVDWQVLPGDLVGKFDSLISTITLDKDGSYAETVRDRGNRAGRWSLQEGVLSIDAADGTMRLSGPVTPLENGFRLEYKDGMFMGFYRSDPTKDANDYLGTIR